MTGIRTDGKKREYDGEKDGKTRFVILRNHWTLQWSQKIQLTIRKLEERRVKDKHK